MQIMSKSPQDRTTILLRLALGVALAYIGSLVNVPIVVTTLALDSLPGFCYALLFSGGEGAVVAAVGHLITAALRGFPYGIPVHIGIMLGMALAAWLLGVIAAKSKQWLGMLAALVVNGLLLPAALIPLLGVPFFAVSVLPLTVAAAINLVLAAAIARVLRVATRE